MLGYSKEDGDKLLKLARASILEEFTRNKVEMPEGKQFNQARGVFVTLTEKGELRGCIGLPYPVKSIKDAVIEAAKSAAFSDPRFLPLKKEELWGIKIEISILTMPQEAEAKDIQVGKDGIMCNCLGYQGLLLPQVATENEMSRLEFLEALCSKAGLPKDSWGKRGFKLWKFQCQIFHE